MFFLAEHELDAISSPSGSVYWTFFGVSASAAVAFGIVLYTVTLPAGKAAFFGALDFASVVMTLFFSAMGILEMKRARRRIAEIKRRPTPTLP